MSFTLREIEEILKALQSTNNQALIDKVELYKYRLTRP
jgi:hypothetical protein